MTSPLDYNQHLLAYVQAWRQLLDASAAMSSGLPLPPGPPGMPPAPPMPFTPPMMPPPATSPTGANPPTDYTQQLFSYLQTWRRYLEQAVGAASGSIQPVGPPSTASPTMGATGSPTTGSTGSQSSGAQSSGAQSTFGSQSKPPIVKPPKDPYGTIGREHLHWKGFDDMFSGSENEAFARANPASGSAFGAKAASVTPSQATQPTTQSLFSGRAAETPSVTTEMRAGRDPRRAAPPATSRWWEAGQGLRPGFKYKPDATNLLNIRPRDLSGGEQ